MVKPGELSAAVSAGIEGCEPLVAPLQLCQKKQTTDLQKHWKDQEQVIYTQAYLFYYLRWQSKCAGLLEGPWPRAQHLDAEVH